MGCLLSKVYKKPFKDLLKLISSWSKLQGWSPWSFTSWQRHGFHVCTLIPCKERNKEGMAVVKGTPSSAHCSPKVSKGEVMQVPVTS